MAALRFSTGWVRNDANLGLRTGCTARHGETRRAGRQGGAGGAGRGGKEREQDERCAQRTTFDFDLHINRDDRPGDLRIRKH